MSAITLELPYNYTTNELNTWLKYKKLTLLKGKSNKYSHVQVGDALKSQNGAICRVVQTLRNEVGEPFIVIANNKLSKQGMYAEFDYFETV